MRKQTAALRNHCKPPSSANAASRGTLAAVAAFLSLLPGVAIAGPLDDGTAAAKRGDYSMAMRLLRPLAEEGNAAAQYDLGELYDSGNGVKQNFAEALKWLRLSAN